jgi:hypothetical protein
MQFPLSLLSHFLSLKSKYSAERLVLKRHQSVFFPKDERDKFYTHVKQQLK